MLNEPDLQKLSLSIFKGRLPAVSLERVLTGAMLDSEGKDAIRITFVLTPQSVDAISGEDALNLLVDIHDGLMREGDERFPIIEYATEAELEEEVTASDESEQDPAD